MTGFDEVKSLVTIYDTKYVLKITKLMMSLTLESAPISVGPWVFDLSTFAMFGIRA